MTDWNSIVREHTPLVWGTAWRLLGNQADAADCFQETFLAALVALATRREPVRHWPALLARIATTRAIDRLRRRRRRSEANGDAVGWETFPAPQAGPAETAQDHEVAPGDLRRILAELSEPHALGLRFLGEWSHEEIARELGMTANAVAVMIHRTRGHLRERLASLVARPEEVEP